MGIVALSRGVSKKETLPRSRLRGRVVDLARQNICLAQLAHHLVYGVFAQGSLRA